VSRVRSDRCFTLDIGEVWQMIRKGWTSGTITYRLGINTKHEHHYLRTGHEDEGTLLLVYDTIYHGPQRMGAKFERVPNGGSTRLAWICPNLQCGRHVKTLFRPYGGAYFLCRFCWNIAYPGQCESKSERLWRKARRLDALLWIERLSGWEETRDAWESAIVPMLSRESEIARATLERIRAMVRLSPDRCSTIPAPALDHHLVQFRFVNGPQL
jgi:hypothetical protein